MMDRSTANIRANDSEPWHLKLTLLAIKRPTSLLMLLSAILVFGIVASQLMQRESWPQLDVPRIYINAPYQGAAPADIEELITAPIEAAIATMTGVTSIVSNSRADSVQIQLNMDLNSDLDSKLFEVREQIERIKNSLPRDLTDIRVQKFSTSDFAIANISLSSVNSFLPAYDLLNHQLISRIQRIPGVARAELQGMMPYQVEIAIDPVKLASAHIETDTLIEAIERANFLSKSSLVELDNHLYMLQLNHQYRALADIRNTLINPNIRIQDVAEVRIAMTPPSKILRINQQEAVAIEVFKTSEANTLAISDSLAELLEQLQSEDAFKDITMVIEDDAGEAIQQAIEHVLLAGILGALSSFAVLFYFIRDVKITTLILATVPVALSFATACMYLMGISLNLLTLAGLFIAIGLLVDNSVVVSESICQSGKQFASRAEVLNRVNKVSLAIVTGTATSVIVFLPLVLGEENGVTLVAKQVAASVCLPLIASLVIAKTLIPAILCQLEGAQYRGQMTTLALESKYAASLAWVLQRPVRSSIVFLLLLVSGLASYFTVASNPDNQGFERELTLIYQIQGEQTPEAIVDYVAEVEAYLHSPLFPLPITKVISQVKKNYANSRIVLATSGAESSAEIKRQILQALPSSTFAKPYFDRKATDPQAIKVVLYGPSTEQLIALSESVIPHLNQIKGVEAAAISEFAFHQVIRLQLKRAKLAQLGLSSERVLKVVRTAMGRKNLPSYYDSQRGELSIELKYFADQTMALQELKQLKVHEKDHKDIKLVDIARFTMAKELQNITRIDRKTSLEIDVSLSAENKKQMSSQLRARMSELELPPHYGWEFDRYTRQQDLDLNTMLVNALLALALIFMVMAALFESLLMPIAIVSSLIFAVVGVFWTFALFGMAMDSSAVIGVLILMGIAVNNGIVLVAQINNSVRSERDDVTTEQMSLVLNIIVSASVSRMRPILMTVTTTIFGMLPLAIASGAEQSQVMTMAIVGGLSFSTIASLYLVPLIYLLLDSVKSASQGMVRDAQMRVGVINRHN